MPEIDKSYELQPLRILGGWSVEFNYFCECDLDTISRDFFGSYFSEDLIRLRNSKYSLLLDLGWYPDGDIDGSYVLHLFYDYNLRSPLEVFESRDRLSVVTKIELWTNYSFFQKYL